MPSFNNQSRSSQQNRFRPNTHARAGGRVAVTPPGVVSAGVSSRPSIPFTEDDMLRMLSTNPTPFQRHNLLAAIRNTNLREVLSQTISAINTPPSFTEVLASLLQTLRCADQNSVAFESAISDLLGLAARADDLTLELTDLTQRFLQLSSVLNNNNQNGNY